MLYPSERTIFMYDSFIAYETSSIYSCSSFNKFDVKYNSNILPIKGIKNKTPVSDKLTLSLFLPFTLDNVLIICCCLRLLRRRRVARAQVAYAHVMLANIN